MKEKEDINEEERLCVYGDNYSIDNKKKYDLS